MQKKLFALTLKSLKYPDKKWDNYKHFIFNHEDRQIVKDEKKTTQETDYIKKSKDSDTNVINFMMSDKEVMKFHFTTQELYDITMKVYLLPHQEKGIWKVKELFNIDITDNQAKYIKKAHQMYNHMMHHAKK